MGEERDPTAFLGLNQRQAAHEELEDEPKTQEEPRRDLADEDDPEEDQCDDARPRQEQQVGAEDGGDGAARPGFGISASAWVP